MYCSCDYYEDNEGSGIFFGTQQRKAKKSYKCHECYRPIEPKDLYYYTSGVWDGSIFYYRYCIHCWNLLEWLQINLPCYCYVYNDLFEYANDQIYEAQHRAPEEMEGFFMQFQRKYYKLFKRVHKDECKRRYKL